MTGHNRFLFQGQWLPLHVIAQRVGMKPGTLHFRVHRKGMTLDEAIAKPITPKHLLTPEGPKPKLYEFRGERLSVKEIAARTGLSVDTIYARRSGDRVLDGDELKDPFPDLPPGSKPIRFRGRTHSIADWARLAGIPKHVLYQRIEAGWPIKRALTEPPMRPEQRAVYSRNRRIIRRIAAAFRPPLHTGGHEATFHTSPGTGAGRHETHFDGRRP